MQDKDGSLQDKNSPPLTLLGPSDRCWSGEGTSSPKPTFTSAEAEDTEDKVDLVKAAEDWPKGEGHDGDEDDTQGQGQHHEAHAHVDENWGWGQEEDCPRVIPRHSLRSTSKCIPTDTHEQHPKGPPRFDYRHPQSHSHSHRQSRLLEIPK